MIASELALPPPHQQRLTLSNGLRVLLLRDTEAPVVRGALLMRGGQRASPPDRVGLATLSAAVQRAGGSTQHPGEELDDALEVGGWSSVCVGGGNGQAGRLP